jgi:hypothetical protein
MKTSSFEYHEKWNALVRGEHAMVRKRFALLMLLILTGTSLWTHASEPVTLKRHGRQVEIVIGGKAFATYYFDDATPKPFLHPLRTASGAIITRGFPMERIPGESTDHPHHRALFFAHGDINGIDFWTEAERAETAPVHAGGQTYHTSEQLPHGRTVFVKLTATKSGGDSGSLSAHFNLVGPDSKVIAEETQAYVFRGDSTTRAIDCEFTIRAKKSPVKLGDTKEGTFAIRVVKTLEEMSGMKMTDSEGRAGEKQIWGKRANWVDYSGAVDGREVGVTIFDHPSNPKHPTYWHARGYGLFAVNPFGERDFYNDPKRDGSLIIAPGGTLVFRYRVLIHEGDASAARLADAWAQYAAGK